MKKLIFKKFSKDLIQFFLLVSLSISLIIWVIQAVNYLDFVTEDGHGFKIYFLYTLLSLPKIFSKILPFIYFLSIFIIVLKYENNNELIIFWTIGIKKIEFVNVLIKFSFFYLFLQLILTTLIVPKSLDQARSYIRSSNVDLYSSIIQEKKFIDTVKNLTIFVNEKSSNGELKNIFLKEQMDDDSYQIIYAKYGNITYKNNKNNLLLFDGKILNHSNNKTNVFKFSKTELNLSKFSTKTTTHPKIQEVTTLNIISCVMLLNNYKIFLIDKKFKKNHDAINCNKGNLKNTYQEIFKRMFLPFYLPVLSLIASLIIIKSKDDYRFSRYKFSLFIIGVFVIIVSELSMRYADESIVRNSWLASIPVILFISIYLYFIKKFKLSNFINKRFLILIKNIY